MSVKLCRYLKKVMTPLSGLSLRTASAEHVSPLAACTARVVIQDTVYTIEFVVLSSCSHDVILGWDFLSSHNAVIDCAKAEIELISQNDPPLSEHLFGEWKITVDEDVDIPPLSSVMVDLASAPVPDGPVLFTPGDLFVRRKELPLPFAVLTVQGGRTRMFYLQSNPLFCQPAPWRVNWPC